MSEHHDGTTGLPLNEHGHLRSTWTALDVDIDSANRPADCHNCYVIPQDPVGDTNGSNFAADDVYFDTPSGRGITLAQALHGQHDELTGRNDRAFPPSVGVSSKISLKIQFQGHNPYNRQVTVLRSTSEAEPVSRGKLAEKIAYETRAALKEQEGLEMDGRAFSFEEIFLWKLRRATRGSWQPEFYVRLPDGA